MVCGTHDLLQQCAFCPVPDARSPVWRWARGRRRGHARRALHLWVGQVVPARQPGASGAPKACVGHSICAARPGASGVPASTV
eukprot:11166080-Lingulodinium_polyedra.AAC.1